MRVCGSLQEVFQLQEQDATEMHDVTVIPLKELHLDHVPKLKYVWNKDPQGIFNFPILIGSGPLLFVLQRGSCNIWNLQTFVVMGMTVCYLFPDYIKFFTLSYIESV